MKKFLSLLHDNTVQNTYNILSIFHFLLFYIQNYFLFYIVLEKCRLLLLLGSQGDKLIVGLFKKINLKLNLAKNLKKFYIRMKEYKLV
jgi:hypothetical protein